MKAQINHKQVTVLVLAVMLAIVSYWIPLPPSPHALSKAATQSVPTEAVIIAHKTM